MVIRLTKILSLAALAATAIACGHKPAPTAEKDAPRPVDSTAQPSATAAADPPPAAKTIPRLVAEKLKPKEGSAGRLFAVEGALMVVDDQRVGRIVGDDIEWIGKIPKEAPGLGDNFIDAVVGRWPDRVAALYRSGQPRAPQPTYYPLTGKAGGYRVASGGGAGNINGIARIGESTLLVSFDYASGHQIVTVQGPPLARPKQKDAQVGCKRAESSFGPPDDAAVPPVAIEATLEGTLASLGRLCGEGEAAAEIWDKAGKSRVIKLGRWWKKLNYGARLLRGSGDDLFAWNGPWMPVLRYHGGDFEAVPFLDAPILDIFTAPDGKLYASDGEVIFRHEEGKWTAVAMLPERRNSSHFAMDDKGTLWDDYATRLREGPGVPVPAACDKPFVYMYASAYINGYQKNFTYPTTQKALRSFPEVASIGLVEFGPDYDRHLGVQVTSRAQGEALISHVKATMKDEDPRLFCYDPPSPRRIEIKAP